LVRISRSNQSTAHTSPGEGTTPTSIKHALFTLRQLLSPTYAVLSLSSSALLTEPWQPSCAALVIPGGADLPYCRVLNGVGNAKIQSYVENGGKYIGLCAGAYYASKTCEFMKGHRVMEVVGDRELRFFPGTCRGLAFNGFRYQSEEGAKAAKLVVNKEVFGKEMEAPAECVSYYNGGGVFVKAEDFADEGVEVLASYKDPLDLKDEDSKAAVILCKVGNGVALLTAPHPEYAIFRVDSCITNGYPDSRQRTSIEMPTVQHTPLLLTISSLETLLGKLSSRLVYKNSVSRSILLLSWYHPSLLSTYPPLIPMSYLPCCLNGQIHSRDYLMAKSSLPARTILSSLKICPISSYLPNHLQTFLRFHSRIRKMLKSPQTAHPQ
jgi:glutamine amidotransferase-like uncharacterized protein